MTTDEESLTRAIGQRLRAQRQAVGISLTELCARTSDALSKSRISNYEQGIRRMGVEEARILAKALGTVSPAYLLHLDDEHPLSPEEQEVLAAYRGLSDEARKVVRRAMALPG